MILELFYHSCCSRGVEKSPKSISLCKIITKIRIICKARIVENRVGVHFENSSFLLQVMKSVGNGAAQNSLKNHKSSSVLTGSSAYRQGDPVTIWACTHDGDKVELSREDVIQICERLERPNVFRISEGPRNFELDLRQAVGIQNTFPHSNRARTLCFQDAGDRTAEWLYALDRVRDQLRRNPSMSMRVFAVADGGADPRDYSAANAAEIAIRIPAPSMLIVAPSGKLKP